jgi:hypothetical protein
VNRSSDVRYLEIGLSAAAFLNVIDHGGPLRLVPKGKFSFSEKKVSRGCSLFFSSDSLSDCFWSVSSRLCGKRKEKRIGKKSGNNVNVQTWYYCSHI